MKTTLIIFIQFFFILGGCTEDHTTKKTHSFPKSTEAPEGMLTLPSEDDNYAAVCVPDIEYLKIGDRSLFLHALFPFMETPMCPVIIFVQGSGFKEQYTKLNLPQLVPFARDGYVVFSVEHRPSDEAKAPAQIQDVRTAIRFIRANADTYLIDPDRIGIWGNSSGGHLAALVGTSEHFETFNTEEYSGYSSGVQAVVNFYGPTDFSKIAHFPSLFDHTVEDSPVSMVIGGSILDPMYEEVIRMFNPISYISQNIKIPPFLIFHGDRDAMVPFNQSVILYEALRDAGCNVTFYKVENAGHDARIWTPRVLNIVKEFFDKHLKNK